MMDNYSPALALDAAAKKASKTGRAHYVMSDGAKFLCVADEPEIPPGWIEQSYWAVDPDGTITHFEKNKEGRFRIVSEDEVVPA